MWAWLWTIEDNSDLDLIAMIDSMLETIQFYNGSIWKAPETKSIVDIQKACMNMLSCVYSI